VDQVAVVVADRLHRTQPEEMAEQAALEPF
jgi:hypothetical protein